MDLQHIIDRAIQNLKKDGTLESVVLLESEITDSKGTITSNYSTDEEKYLFYDEVVPACILQMKATEFVQISEVWFVKYKPNDSTPPKECPDRKEGILIVHATGNGITQALIPFERKGNEIIVETPQISDGDERQHNLLRNCISALKTATTSHDFCLGMF